VPGRLDRFTRLAAPAFFIMADVLTEFVRIKAKIEDLGRVLSHVRSNPSLDNLKALADKYKALKIHLDQILEKL
jgi:hypothetical protein